MNPPAKNSGHLPLSTGLVDHARMREMNLALILSGLREHGRLSRSRLSKITGLTKATVSSLVKELIERKFVHEVGQVSNVIGRPSIELELNPGAGCIIGAEIGVGFISVILADFSAEVLWRAYRDTTPFERQRGPVMTSLLKLLREAAEQARLRGEQLLGLGLGLPGLVNVDSGQLLFAPNLHWEDVPVRDILAREFNFPLQVDNEANLAALGESYFGAGRDASFVLFVSSGVGLGGGIVYNKEILRGVSGLAGEIGHMSIDPQGPPCNCGSYGCWETLVSPEAVFQRVMKMAALGRESVLLDWSGGKPERLSIPLVAAAAEQGDAVALEALAETGRYLGIGIANLINALNPERVILGGILSKAGAFLLPAIQAEVDVRALSWSRQGAQLALAHHGADACVIGGVASVYHRVLSQPTLMCNGR